VCLSIHIARHGMACPPSDESVPPLLILTTTTHPSHPVRSHPVPFHPIPSRPTGEGEKPGVSLMGAQLKLARQRIVWNIARMLGAIALGTVVLVPLEHWTWGYGVFFSSQMIMGSGQSVSV
jgi:hypothetical protein